MASLPKNKIAPPAAIQRERRKRCRTCKIEGLPAWLDRTVELTLKETGYMPSARMLYQSAIKAGWNLCGVTDRNFRDHMREDSDVWDGTQVVSS